MGAPPPDRSCHPVGAPGRAPLTPYAFRLLPCRSSTSRVPAAIPVLKRSPEMDGRAWAGTESVPVGTGYHRPPLPRSSLPQYHDWPQRAGQRSSCEADAGQRGAPWSGAHAVIPVRRRSGGLVASRSRNPVSPADGGAAVFRSNDAVSHGMPCLAPDHDRSDQCHRVGRGAARLIALAWNHLTTPFATHPSRKSPSSAHRDTVEVPMFCDSCSAPFRWLRKFVLQFTK